MEKPAQLALSEPNHYQFYSNYDYYLALERWRACKRALEAEMAAWCNQQNLGNQILRWFACVPLHAIYAAMDAAFLSVMWKRIQASKDEKMKFLWFVLCVAVVSILHGIYDTFCSLPFVGFLLDASSLGLLWFVVRWASRELKHSRDSVSASLSDFDPISVETFGKSFAIMYIVIAVGMITWCVTAIN